MIHCGHFDNTDEVEKILLDFSSSSLTYFDKVDRQFDYILSMQIHEVPYFHAERISKNDYVN